MPAIMGAGDGFQHGRWENRSSTAHLGFAFLAWAGRASPLAFLFFFLLYPYYGHLSRYLGLDMASGFLG